MPTLITKGAMSVQALGFGAPQGGGGGGYWLAVMSNPAAVYPYYNQAFIEIDASLRLYFTLNNSQNSIYHGSMNDDFTINYSFYNDATNSNNFIIVSSAHGNFSSLTLLDDVYSVYVSEDNLVSFQAAIQKLSSNGSFTWGAQDVRDPNIDLVNSFLTSVSQNSIGDIICVGSWQGQITNVIPTVETGGLLISAFNPSGGNIWNKVTGLPSGVPAAGVGFLSGIDSVDNIYFWYAYGDFSGSYGYIGVTDSTGTPTWFKQLSGSEIIGPALTNSSGITYLCYGSSILKINNLGSIVWQKTYTKGAPPTNPTFNAMCFDSAGNVYLIGQSTSYDNVYAGTDIYLLKIDSSGNILWQKTITAAELFYAQSVTVDAADNVYVGATIDVNAAVSASTFFAKLPANGSFNGTCTVGGYDVTIADDSYAASSVSTYSLSNATFSSDIRTGPNSTSGDYAPNFQPYSPPSTSDSPTVAENTSCVV